MKNKLIVIIVISFIFLIIANFNFVYATIDTSQYEPPSLQNYGSFIKMSERLIGTIQYVGIIATVIVIAIIGIKYMLGSIEEKAEYKKTMLPLIVGCAFLMCSSIIVNIISNVVSEKNYNGQTYEDYEDVESTESAYELGKNDAEKYINENKGNVHNIIEKYFSICKICAELDYGEDSYEDEYYDAWSTTLRRYINKNNLKNREDYLLLYEEHKEWLKERNK